MNKRTNTIIFILIGTLIDLTLAIIFALAFIFLSVKIAPLLGLEVMNLVPIAVIGGVLLAMFVYQKIVKWAVVKYDLEERIIPFADLRGKKKIKK